MFGFCIRGFAGISGCAVGVPVAGMVIAGLTVVSVAGVVAKIVIEDNKTKNLP